MIVLYNILMFTGIALGFPLIIPMVLASDKRRKTLLPRLGLAALPEGISEHRSHKPDSKPIWVHALSVGEVISAFPLVKGLSGCFRDRNIVFSVSTKTGIEIADRLLKDYVDAIFFFPYDLAFSVKHISAKVDPAIVVIVESDIWPNFLFEMKRRKVPVALVNARLSNRSFLGYRRLSFFMEPLFLTFSKICTQTVEDAWRFEHLGVPSNRITKTGNLKFDQKYDPISKVELQRLRRSMHIRPGQNVLVAGSTHKGEETILVDAFSRMKEEFWDLLFIIAPRDPNRAESVCQIFRSAGFSAYLLKDLDRLAPDTRVDVIVIDTIGILKRLYALGDIAFVGGSLVHSGGQNPLEPALFSKPVLFGPDMSDFKQISHMLLESGGAFRVHDAESLYDTAAMLLWDHDRSKNMGKSAFDVFYANKGAVEKTVDAIKSILIPQ
ncbi:MAG: 3-deoxy-D-manno-octulosonic acid transferase [Deltaproteobacteria bacterium]|nr:MAG: 3-deoxy-D-manno-octulosonic acid transferase [Deltaproteobacteria bacterium]